MASFAAARRDVKMRQVGPRSGSIQLMQIPLIADNELKQASFLKVCDEWLCDGYSYDIRYVATATDSGFDLFDVVIILSPLPPTVDNTLVVRAGSFIAGQAQAADIGKSQLMTIVKKALSGFVSAEHLEGTLPQDGPYQIQLGAMSAATWFQPLTCKVIGAAPNVPIADVAALDTSLRTSDPPFDGAEDLRAWLGVRLPAREFLSAITITVNPPVDLLIDRSGFIEDRLRLVLTSHKNANRSLVRLAVRSVPGDGLKCRSQLGHKIEWQEGSTGLVEGTVEIALPDETAGLSMLVVGSETVRRHWFVHPTKSLNYRWVAFKQFDPGLKMIRRGLFESTDSRRFEAAVAALLFALGFSSALQLETDAPDIVAVTPAGRIILVECATRIAEVGAKIGKLVDRRGALQRTLRSGNKAIDVTAALVCRLPRDQIATRSEEVAAMGLLLATAETLNEALIRAEVSADADQILDQALQDLARDSTA